MPFAPVPVRLIARAHLEGQALVFQDAIIVVKYLPFEDSGEPALEPTRVLRSCGVEEINKQWFAVQRIRDLDGRALLAITFKGATFSQAIMTAISADGDPTDRALYDALILGEQIQLDLGEGRGDPVVIELGYVSG